MKNLGKRYIIRIKKNHPDIRLAAVAACLIVICLPIHTFTIGGMGLLLLLGVPLLVLCVPALLHRLRDTTWDKATLLLGAFFAYNVLAYAWTPSFSGYSVYNYLKNVAIVMCLYSLDLRRREKKLLLAGAVLASLIVCWFVVTGRNIGLTDRRVTLAVFGVEQDPNYLGYLFLVPMAVAVYQFINNKSVLVRTACVLLAVLVLFCTLMTGSRGALLGLIVVVMICIIKQFRGLLPKILFVTAMTILAMALYLLVLSLLPDYLADRFSVQSIIDSRGTGRLDLWQDAFRAMAEEPWKILLGFGTNSSKPVIGWATHNFIIQLLLEVGLVGTTLFLWFLWTWVRRLARCDTMCLSIIMGCMAMAMTLSVNTIYYFWVIFTLSIVCSKAKPWKTEDDTI